MAPLDLQNKVAIVTGASHPLGIGFAACSKLAEAGAMVVLTDLVVDEQGRDQLEQRAKELGDNGFSYAVDITKREQIDACVEFVLKRYGQVDILFNNAGSPGGVGNFLQMTDQQWDSSYQVNLKGAVDFCQAVLPSMIEQDKGAIINNASLAGLGATSQMAAYTATKFALVGLTKALAAEFGQYNIRVNAVCPGMIWTQMGIAEIDLLSEQGESFEQTKQRLVTNDVAMGRWGVSGEVADAVLYLASDLSSYINGVSLPVAGGMAAGL